VMAQLRAAGLLVDSLVVSGKIVRCKVEGDREKRGWYVLHELRTDDDYLIAGSYGVWRGNDNGAQKIKIDRSKLTDQQYKALQERIREDKKKADAERRRQAERAALRAHKVWAKCLPSDTTGANDYLIRKGVQAHGIRYTESGALVIPMLDVSGTVHGLQFILNRKSHASRIGKTGRDKEFWPAGLQKQGRFFLIGMPSGVAVICEGYATGASIHEATGLPVAIAFDAGNMPVVASILRKRYKTVRWVLAADDDDFQKCRHCRLPVRVSQGKTCPHCGEGHGAKNAGIEAAEAAALAVDGAVAIPNFEDDAKRWREFETRSRKITDFNDLHLAEGLQAVRRQIEAVIESKGWRRRIDAGSGGESPAGGAGNGGLRPIETLQELLDRFSMVYGHGGAAFDHQEHILIAMSDVRDLCIRRELYRAWMEHPERKIVRQDEVGFDPACKDKAIKCNLWSGWPTQPKPGNCENLLDLLGYMCSREGKRSKRLYEWVLKWLAYPIQNPGAKMRTAIVVHGPQGTGKNLFFESIMQIYGPYGRIIDQSAVEDKFNDWASKKLFLIADEVIARSELFHIKNKLKGLITGEWIRINPKQIKAYDEKNHVNMVFLSNERMPVVLEEDDRRYCVIWTPPKLSKEFYLEVKMELRNGGVEALHHYLMNLDLSGFDEHAKPPETMAKEELIHLSMDTTSEFYYELEAGEFGELNSMPVLTEDLFKLYRRWCAVRGYRSPANQKRLVDTLVRKHDVQRAKRKWVMDSSVGKRQRSFLVLPGVPPKPPDCSEEKWYTESMERSKNLIQDWVEAWNNFA